MKKSAKARAEVLVGVVLVFGGLLLVVVGVPVAAAADASADMDGKLSQLQPHPLYRSLHLDHRRVLTLGEPDHLPDNDVPPADDYTDPDSPDLPYGDAVTGYQLADSFSAAPSYADPSLLSAVMQQADQANFRYPLVTPKPQREEETDQSSSGSDVGSVLSSPHNNEINPYYLFPPQFHEFLDIPLHTYSNGSVYSPHRRFRPVAPLISKGYATLKIQGNNKHRTQVDQDSPQVTYKPKPVFKKEGKKPVEKYTTPTTTSASTTTTTTTTELPRPPYQSTRPPSEPPAITNVATTPSPSRRPRPTGQRTRVRPTTTPYQSRPSHLPFRPPATTLPQHRPRPDPPSRPPSSKPPYTNPYDRPFPPSRIPPLRYTRRPTPTTATPPPRTTVEDTTTPRSPPTPSLPRTPQHPTESDRLDSRPSTSPELRPTLVKQEGPPLAKPSRPVTVDERPPVSVDQSRPVEKPHRASADHSRPAFVDRPRPDSADPSRPSFVSRPSPKPADRPTTIDQPYRVSVGQSRPASVDRPRPVSLDQPRPSFIERPRPVSIKRPTPVDRPRPLATSKPQSPEFEKGENEETFRPSKVDPFLPPRVPASSYRPEKEDDEVRLPQGSIQELPPVFNTHDNSPQPPPPPPPPTPPRATREPPTSSHPWRSTVPPLPPSPPKPPSLPFLSRPGRPPLPPGRPSFFSPPKRPQQPSLPPRLNPPADKHPPNPQNTRFPINPPSPFRPDPPALPPALFEPPPNQPVPPQPRPGPVLGPKINQQPRPNLRPPLQIVPPAGAHPPRPQDLPNQPDSGFNLPVEAGNLPRRRVQDDNHRRSQLVETGPNVLPQFRPNAPPQRETFGFQDPPPVDFNTRPRPLRPDRRPMLTKRPSFLENFNFFGRAPVNRRRGETGPPVKSNSAGSKVPHKEKGGENLGIHYHLTHGPPPSQAQKVVVIGPFNRPPPGAPIISLPDRDLPPPPLKSSDPSFLLPPLPPPPMPSRRISPPPHKFQAAQHKFPSEPQKLPPVPHKPPHALNKLPPKGIASQKPQVVAPVVEVKTQPPVSRRTYPIEAANNIAPVASTSQNPLKPVTSSPNFTLTKKDKLKVPVVVYGRPVEPTVYAAQQDKILTEVISSFNVSEQKVVNNNAKRTYLNTTTAKMPLKTPAVTPQAGVISNVNLRKENVFVDEVSEEHKEAIIASKVKFPPLSSSVERTGEDAAGQHLSPKIIPFPVPLSSYQRVVPTKSPSNSFWSFLGFEDPEDTSAVTVADRRVKVGSSVVHLPPPPPPPTLGSPIHPHRPHPSKVNRLSPKIRPPPPAPLARVPPYPPVSSKPRPVHILRPGPPTTTTTTTTSTPSTTTPHSTTPSTTHPPTTPRPRLTTVKPVELKPVYQHTSTQQTTTTTTKSTATATTTPTSKPSTTPKAQTVTQPATTIHQPTTSSYSPSFIHKSSSHNEDRKSFRPPVIESSSYDGWQVVGAPQTPKEGGPGAALSPVRSYVRENTPEIVILAPKKKDEGEIVSGVINHRMGEVEEDGQMVQFSSRLNVETPGIVRSYWVKPPVLA